MIKIAAVVVTYNRKELLRECLEAIYSQSFEVSDIYLVDNASTDGTKAMLEENGYLNRKNFHYVIETNNLGGAGGFYEGLKLVRETDADWAWIMDDDTVPEEDCLEKLVEASIIIEQQSIKTSFFASCVYGKNGEYMNVPTVDRTPTESGYAGWYGQLNKGMVQIWKATFVSLLIRRDVIVKCGLPCKDYFIWGDDYEYTMRITRHYGKAYLVGNSVAIHKRKIVKSLNLKNETDINRIMLMKFFIRNNAINNYIYARSSRIRTIIKEFFDGLKLLKSKNGLLKFKVLIAGNFEAVIKYKHFEQYIHDQINVK